jgi:hypothetical protein
MHREEVHNPTVSSEAELLTAVLEAQEGRYVATGRVPSAFIQTDAQTKDADGIRTIMNLVEILFVERIVSTRIML